MIRSRFIAIFVALTILCSCIQVDFAATSHQNPTDSALPASELRKADQLASQISTTEWLGPMAPIALSPFFGITCLSAMSVFGQDTFIAENEFISSNPVLQSHYVFWTFLVLTLLTSLPRLTKVSKPIAQVLDQVEAYSGIITIIVIRLVAATHNVEAAAQVEPQMLQMGFLSFTTDMLLIVAAAINIFVINLVKFFFEALIWITPFPMIDATFEICNKTICLVLMAIYAWSPWVATILNLILFAICAILFRWVHRGAVYMRTMLTDPIWKLLSKTYGEFKDRNELVVFPQRALGDFPAKSKLMIRGTQEGWQLECRRFPWFPNKVIDLDRSTTNIELKAGFLLNKLIVTGEHEGKLVFSRRYSDQLELVADKMGFEFSMPAEEAPAAIA